LTVAGAVVGLATAVPAARAEVGVGVGDGDAGAGLVAPDVTPAAAPQRASAVFHPPFWAHGHGRPDYQPGDPGIGDPYFPLEGNGGYDTQHYDLTFSYDPATDRLEGLAVITARATQDLSRFDLDLQQLDVDSVTVDLQRATFNRDGQELQITPKNGIHAGRTFVTTVRYGGAENLIIDGPYADTKEALGGYFVFDAADLDEALEVAQRIPAVRLGGAVEVRPLVEVPVETAH